MNQNPLARSGVVAAKPQSPTVNRRILLNSRPVGAPTADNFRLEEGAVPVPSAGELPLRTLYLSLDPYMRGRMSDAPSYAPPVAIGDAMVGGAVFDAVLPLLNARARVPLCGLIAHYNDIDLPPGPDRLGLLTRTLLE